MVIVKLVVVTILVAFSDSLQMVRIYSLFIQNLLHLGKGGSHFSLWLCIPNTSQGIPTHYARPPVSIASHGMGQMLHHGMGQTLRQGSLYIMAHSILPETIVIEVPVSCYNIFGVKGDMDLIWAVRSQMPDSKKVNLPFINFNERL